MLVIEDFFRLVIDVLLYYPYQAIHSNLMKPVLSAASSSLTLLKEEPLIATLHFLRDFLAYGGETPLTSSFDGSSTPAATNSEEMQSAVKQLLAGEGEALVQRIMTGMMYTFPRDCFPDASGVLLGMFQVLPQQTAGWLGSTLSMLPEGSTTPQESERLLSSINQ